MLPRPAMLSLRSHHGVAHRFGSSVVQLGRHRCLVRRAQAVPGPPSASELRHAEERQRLERLLLPLDPSKQAACGPSSGAADVPEDALPAASQQQQQQGGEAQLGKLLPPAAVVAVEAVLEPSSASSSGRHKNQGPLNSIMNDALAKFGISFSDRTKGLIFMNIAVLLYATNWVVVKDSGTGFDPYAFSFMRFLVAAAAFSPFLLQADKRVVKAGIELGLWTGVGYLLQSLGLLTTDASRASFLSTFTVILVPILAGLSGRGVAPLTWFAAVAALGGMSLLEGGGGSPPSIGDVFSLLSALAFGVQVFRTEVWARRLGPQRLLPLTAVMLAVTMGVAMGAGTLAHPAAVLELVQHPQQALEGLSLPWESALYTGLLTTDVCLLMEVTALGLISSTEAAIIFALEPVLGAAFAYALLGERWGPLGWAGAGLIIASSLATQLYGEEEAPLAVESGSESEGEQ